MVETKPVVSVQLEFEHREKLRTKGFLWNFRTVRILMQGRIKMMFIWIFVCKCCVSGGDPNGGSRPCSGWKLGVWISIEIKINSTFWNIWTVTNHLNGSKQKIFNRIILNKHKVFDKDLGWRNHTYSLWEIWVWLSGHIKSDEQFLNFLTLGIMMEGSRKLVFQSNHPPQMSSFRSGPWWKISRL